MLRALFKKKVFIPFIMAGHPSLVDTKEALRMLSQEGVDAIELGVPFSDPVADGVVNQQAAAIALSQLTTLGSILDLVQSIRLEGITTPIILFSYFNPILAYGVDAFIRDALAKGVQGILVVDLPPEEGEVFYARLKEHGLAFVLLVSPTTHQRRLTLFKRLDPAFIYYISRCAVTGMQHALPASLHQEIDALKACFPDYPIAVGFGISNAKQAASILASADGVVVGSALVSTLEKEGLDACRRCVQSFVDVTQPVGVHDDH